MIRFKINFWGMKAGDSVPAHKIDELKMIAPEVIYDDEAKIEDKAIDSPINKMIGKAPKDK